MGGGGKGGGGVQYVPAPQPTMPTGPSYEDMAKKEQELADMTENARKSYASEMEARRQLQAQAAMLGGEDEAKLKRPSLLGGGAVPANQTQ